METNHEGLRQKLFLTPDLGVFSLDEIVNQEELAPVEKKELYEGLGKLAVGQAFDWVASLVWDNDRKWMPNIMRLKRVL